MSEKGFIMIRMVMIMAGRETKIICADPIPHGETVDQDTLLM